MDGQSTPREQAEAMQFDSVRDKYERWSRAALLELKQRIGQAERMLDAYDTEDKPITTTPVNGITAVAASFETSVDAWAAVEEVAFLRPGGKR
jgi:hypothetical protein